ncbi:3-hydroxy-2-methylbutyryl-CoA dehydrogenase [Dirofilaria immitis]|nr:3-hydroxy-2-methylbutyryl-CoA dehydrogenase [Dirofilaria immitis]
MATYLASVKGIVTLITGAASGLGAGTARHLVEHGAKVVIMDLPQSNGETLAKEMGQNCLFTAADVRSSVEVSNAFQTLINKFGQLDAVINCAGVSYPFKLYNLQKKKACDAELIRKTFDVNVFGTFNVIQQALETFALKGKDSLGFRGVIINTASIAAYDGQVGQSAYAASKGAIVSATLAFARDYAEDGIRFMTIAPGLLIPLNELGSPEEFGALVRHIIENRYLNGEVIRLDDVEFIFKLENYTSLRRIVKKDKAAALFDSVFANQPKACTSLARPLDLNPPSKPTSPKRDQAHSEVSTPSPSSSLFLSPTVSIPDFEKSDESDEEEDNGNKFGSNHSSTCTLDISMTHATISDGKSSTSSSPVKQLFDPDANRQKTGIFKHHPTESNLQRKDEEDEDTEDNNEIAPQAKRARPEEECTSSQEKVGSSGKGYSLGIKATYKHRWMLDDDDDGDDGLRLKHSNTGLITSGAEGDGAVNPANTSTVGQSGILDRNRKGERSHIWIRDVKEAHECLKSGEQDDFSDDVKYILSTLLDPSSSNNLKCLSVISLAKKCVSSEFRRFFRSNNLISRILKAIPDSPKSPSLALCISVVVYLLSRDTTSVFVDASALRLFSQLLKLEHPNPSEECSRYSKMVMDILREWLEKSFANTEPKKFSLILRKKLFRLRFSFWNRLFICARKHREQSLQSELLNVGILQWIVSKMDKTVLRLLHEKISDEDILLCLKVLERCFRILESATVCNEKNGAYLISHRGALSFSHAEVGRLGDDINELKEQNITCLNRMVGLLMSLSYENELCSTKLGQMNDFLSLCVSCFTYLVPKYVRKEKQFDLIVLLCSLLVNLLERCNFNRRKLIGLTVPVYDLESKIEKQEPTLKALTTFSYLYTMNHWLVLIDEELDNDLVIEDAQDDSVNHEEETEDNGRLHRLPTELSEDEMVEAVQNAMNKASSHMEDSVLASYFALLIGCLLLQNEESVNVVKAEMKDGKLVALIEQLQRFLEFIKLTYMFCSDILSVAVIGRIANRFTSGKKAHVRFMERIIDLLDTLDN